MAQSTMILPFSILTFATPISFSAVMISCRLALREKRKWMKAIHIRLGLEDYGLVVPGSDVAHRLCQRNLIHIEIAFQPVGG